VDETNFADHFRVHQSMVQRGEPEDRRLQEWTQTHAAGFLTSCPGDTGRKFRPNDSPMGMPIISGQWEMISSFTNCPRLSFISCIIRYS